VHVYDCTSSGGVATERHRRVCWTVGRRESKTFERDVSRRLPSALGRPRLRVRGEARGRCVYETNLKEGMRLPREWLEAAGDGGREADEREPN
jgi:hypothetical protein